MIPLDTFPFTHFFLFFIYPFTTIYFFFPIFIKYASGTFSLGDRGKIKDTMKGWLGPSWGQIPAFSLNVS